MGISIRVVLIGMMIVLAVVACLIIGSIMYSAGITSANHGAKMLRREVVERKQLEIGRYFNEPMSVLSSLQAASRIPGTFNRANFDTWDQWLCSMLRINKGRPTYVGTEDGFTTYTEPRGTQQEQCWVWKVNPIVGVGYVALMNYTTGGTPFYVDYNAFDGPTTFDPRQRPWYNVSKDGNAWSTVYVNHFGQQSAVTPGAPVWDPALQRSVGVFATDFTTTILVDYLRRDRVATSGKMILVERQTRNVVGSSWDEPAVLSITRTDAGPFRNETATELVLARLTNYTEPLLKKAIGALGLDFLFDCGASRAAVRGSTCEASFGKGRDRVFVDLVDVRDEFGLDLRLIVLIPEADFLDEMWRRADVAVGAAVGAGLGLVLLAVVVVYFVLKPLQRVEERLYQTATLEDKDDDDAVSAFTEIARIQEAYAKMVAELKRIRSYVPQSLLRTLDNVAGAEDDAGDAESEGKLCATSVVSGSENGAAGDDMASKTKKPPSTGERSHQSMRTTHSAASKAALAAGRHLHTDVGLVPRRVTVLVVNLAGFHRRARRLDPTQLLTYHAETLKHINDVVTAHKGILDLFMGDHFTITFNAVTAVASHVTRAAATILAIASKVHTANFGAATGQVLCGNAGIHEIKRFSIIGPVMNQAHVLERLCRLLRVPSLVSFACVETMQFEYHVQCVDVVQLPFTKTPAPIATIVAAKSVVHEEWLYTATSSTELTEHNAAFLRYVDGDIETARAILAQMPADAPTTQRLRDMVNQPLEVYAARFGIFYNVALNVAAAEDDGNTLAPPPPQQQQ